MKLIIIALAPVLIIVFYIYFRDKYEKEPIGILLRTFIAGCLTVLPILPVEEFFTYIWQNYAESNFPHFMTAFFHSFVVASFTEETFKFLAFLLLVWRNKNFNEKYDGIVYAVFVSLGFATVENILYVIDGGAGTGVLRAFTAVPAHAIFGITMGFYLGLAKLEEYNKSANILKAILIPILLHGIYDFIIFLNINWVLLFFIPYLIYMYIFGLKKIKQHVSDSEFRITTNIENTNILLDNNIKAEEDEKNTNAVDNKPIDF